MEVTTMKKNTKKTTWEDVLQDAMERNEIGAMIAKLKPILHRVMDAVDKDDIEAAKRQRERLHKAIKKTAEGILDKWDMTPKLLDAFLDEVPRK